MPSSTFSADYGAETPNPQPGNYGIGGWLWEPENRDAIVVERIVIEFRAHVDDVGDACADDLISVGFGRDITTNIGFSTSQTANQFLGNVWIFLLLGCYHKRRSRFPQCFLAL